MTTALYRRYRPQTFAEVIGQDHVTAPLRAALRNGQVNHAYLFSGPRGCGKTSSARILARVLNCARNTPEHPTDTPCGECESCVELATGGPGSLDVVEIDAASHGGVDDARELRERATYAPARDRYKVFILDEAHMVSNQGFNALLKIVEEPPPHVKFVFATTEPDKVIGTIRSRTHHYPFRLVPPDVLVPYLAQVCETEGVPVGAGVLPLVVRAGAGSVRDSLSVLDQLIAGAGEGGLEYEGAVALLGYTPAALLDDLVDAIAARDGATAFSVVERVVATGHEPRRFVEDLLERLRDLIVLAAAGEAAGPALGALPADQLARMRAQASHLGWSELSRSADLANAALTEMVGATSPRLQLELLMARLLLPAADDGTAGLGARLDRLERGWPASGAAPAAGSPARGSMTPGDTAVPPVAVDTPADAPRAAGPAAVATPVAPPARAASPGPAQSVAAASPAPASPAPELGYERPDGTRQTVRGVAPTPEPAGASDEAVTVHEPTAPAAEPAAAVAPHLGTGGVADTEMLRRRWPEVLDTLSRLRKATWILVSQNAQVQSLDATTLRLSFPTEGLVGRFRDHADVVARAVHETLGFDVHVQAVAAGGAPATGATPIGAPARSASPPPTTPARGIPTAEEAEASWSAPSSGRAAPPPTPTAPAPAPAAPGGRVPGTASSAGTAQGSGHAAAEPGPTAADRPGQAPPQAEDDPGDEDDDVPPPIGPPDDDLDDLVPGPETPPVPEEDEPSDDDPVIEGSNLVGAPLVARLLGGTVIDEQVTEPEA